MNTCVWYPCVSLIECVCVCVCVCSLQVRTKSVHQCVEFYYLGKRLADMQRRHANRQREVETAEAMDLQVNTLTCTHTHTHSLTQAHTHTHTLTDSLTQTHAQKYTPTHTYPWPVAHHGGGSKPLLFPVVFVHPLSRTLYPSTFNQRDSVVMRMSLCGVWRALPLFTWV